MTVIKKINAVLSLLTVSALFIHIGYTVFSYLTFFYNPTLKIITALPFMILTCVHAVLGMCSVFLLNDGTRLDIYGKQNVRTMIQRISAALIFPLLFIHLKTFALLKTSSESGRWFLFVLVIVVQVLFFAVVLLHTSVSFSKALITLGFLKNTKTLRGVDKAVFIVCALTFLVASFAVVRGQSIMFLPK